MSTPTLTNYYFIRYNNYCSCCTFNYKIYVVKAESEDDLGKLILENDTIRKALIVCGYSSCEDCGQTCQTFDEDPKQVCRCNNIYMIGANLSFFSDSGPFNKSVESMIKYYSKKDGKDILEELKVGTSEDYEFLYLGDEETARKSLLFQMPNDSMGMKIIDGGIPMGQIVFEGKKIFEDLNCTTYGKEYLN